LSSADKAKLAKCLEDVLDVVGDTIPEKSVKEAIVRCDFDSDVAVNTLLNNPVGHKSGQQQQQQQQPKTSTPVVAPSAAVSRPRPIARPSLDGARPKVSTSDAKPKGAKPKIIEVS